MENLELNSQSKLQFTVIHFNDFINKEFNNDKCKLIIVSCFFTVSFLKDFIICIKTMLGKNLVKIEIYLERSQITLQYEELKKEILENNFFLNKVKNSPIEFKIPKNNNSQLFHAKAYCLTTNDSSWRGRLILGSANLTYSGFGLKKRGNQEIVYCTKNPEDIKNFCNVLPSQNEIEGIEEARNSELMNEATYMLRLIRDGNLLQSFSNTSRIETALQVNFAFKKNQDITTRNVDDKGIGYYFYDENDPENYELRDLILDGEIDDIDGKDIFKQSKEYKQILAIFLKANMSYSVNWGKQGITIFDSFFWLPKSITEYLNDNFNLREELKTVFTDTLIQTAINKLASDIKYFYDNDKLHPDWIDEYLKNKYNDSVELLIFDFEKRINDYEIREAAIKIIETKIKDFLENSSTYLKRYKINNVLINACSSNEDNITKEIFNYIKEAKHTSYILKKCLEQATQEHLDLSCLQPPLINRVDYVNDDDFCELLIANLMCFSNLTFNFETISFDKIHKKLINQTKIQKLKIPKIQKINILLKEKKRKIAVIEIYYDSIKKNRG